MVTETDTDRGDDGGVKVIHTRKGKTMDRIARAARFFEENGRDIDRAAFAYHFAGGSRDDLLGTLARHQNPDGGFGYPLEVDIKAPDSNPFAVVQALLICLWAGAPPEHPVLQGIVRYLEQTQDEDGGWRFAPAIYQHELAPWFAGWEWPSLNPSCCLAGLLRELGIGSEVLHQRVEGLFERLARSEALLGDEYYNVMPYVYYFLPESDLPGRELYLAGALWWLIRQHTESKLADAVHFLDYVRAPDTYMGRNLPREILDAELDRLESEQQEDGGWPSPYDPAWRGPSTVEALLILKAFGRV